MGPTKVTKSNTTSLIINSDLLQHNTKLLSYSYLSCTSAFASISMFNHFLIISLSIQILLHFYCTKTLLPLTTHTITKAASIFVVLTQLLHNSLSISFCLMFQVLTHYAYNFLIYPLCFIFSIYFLMYTISSSCLEF